MTRSRTVAATAIVLTAGLLAGCGSNPTTATESAAPAPTATATTATATTAPPATSRAATIEVAADTAALEHIHNLGLTDDTLLIGTHQGLFGQPAGEPPRRVSEAFDVMGFTIDGDRWLSSGHPGVGMNAPSDLGLLESRDQGNSWTDVSLAGQVDFHRIAAGGNIVLGVNSGDGMLWRSADGGNNWNTVGPGPFDIAVNPRNVLQAVGTTQDGPISSNDGGITWTPITGSPLIALLAWTDDRLWGITPAGEVLFSTDAGTSWRNTGKVDGSPTALTANRTHVNVLAGDTIWESLDQGATFNPRVTGLPGH